MHALLSFQVNIQVLIHLRTHIRLEILLLMIVLHIKHRLHIIHLHIMLKPLMISTTNANLWAAFQPAIIFIWLKI